MKSSREGTPDTASAEVALPSASLRGTRGQREPCVVLIRKCALFAHDFLRRFVAFARQQNNVAWERLIHRKCNLFDASRGPVLPTGTTYGTISPGQAADTGAYFVRYNGATGQVDLGPTLLDPAGAEQTFPDISADGGVLHTLWWDARNAARGCGSLVRTR